MSKFNVGDRVKYVGKSERYVSPNHIGKAGTVKCENDEYPYCFDVLFDDGTSNRGTYPDNLELIKIVALTGPIRTVTRREIVPGQYGHIEISDVNEDGASLWLPRNKRWTSDELREAAHVLNQIAEALEDE